jgi:hypothetical protein
MTIDPSNPVDDLPNPEDDKLLMWVYNHVHAIYAEHWSKLYDRTPDKAISLSILLTYRAIQLALSENLTTDEDDDEDDGTIA